MTILPTPPNGRFQHFGHALRHYRETISDRLGRSDLPRMQVTAAALLKCVEQGGSIVISQAIHGLVAQKLGEDIANASVVINEEELKQRMQRDPGRASAWPEASTPRAQEEER